MKTGKSKKRDKERQKETKRKVFWRERLNQKKRDKQRTRETKYPIKQFFSTAGTRPGTGT
jgi:hypothetical protein